MHMGLHSECDNWLQTGTSADSTKLLYTENKFILNKFPTGCEGCLFVQSEK